MLSTACQIVKTGPAEDHILIGRKYHRQCEQCTVGKGTRIGILRTTAPGIRNCSMVGTDPCNCTPWWRDYFGGWILVRPGRGMVGRPAVAEQLLHAESHLFGPSSPLPSNDGTPTCALPSPWTSGSPSPTGSSSPQTATGSAWESPLSGPSWRLRGPSTSSCYAGPYTRENWTPSLQDLPPRRSPTAGGLSMESTS
ncbi:uncharacterized protein LOC102449525 isoform X2 [Pelodiscus sinensis]|uniref:uncharacterized protein LOC102449525 isoform X2 n=1 Tax=Pelodiscus sinensis TaxID=13735 RepID=UPI003F6B80D3